MKTRIALLLILASLCGCASRKEVELPGYNSRQGVNWYFWQSKPKQEPLPGSENWDSFHNELKK